MKLENRLPQEGINASQDHPLKELVWLLAGSVAVLVALTAAIGWGAGWIAPRIAYRYEARLAAQLNLTQPPAGGVLQPAHAELQVLADRLARHMALPEGMQVRIGLRDDDAVNAFATLGGQIVMLRGLMVKLDSEDAIAMVLAHEMAHLKYRHPAQALGRGMGVAIVLSVVSSELARGAAGQVLAQAGVATVLAFNREQESEADQEALRVLAAEYGHVGGALDLFRAMGNLPAEATTDVLPPIAFLRTHPLTASRVAAVRAWSEAHAVAADGPRRPLTPALARARRPASR